MPAVVNVMADEAMLVTLVKPQFEAHRSQVWKCILSTILPLALRILVLFDDEKECANKVYLPTIGILV